MLQIGLRICVGIGPAVVLPQQEDELGKGQIVVVVVVVVIVLKYWN